MSDSVGASSPSLRLGLVGDNIAQSRAPMLHRLAGELAGIDVSYDLLVPRDLGLDFDAVVARCREAGMRGLNITYPYKQRVMAHLTRCEEPVKRLGASNTIVFADGGVEGYNTDHSGFVAAYRAVFSDTPPGVVAQFGAGGVGRAVAFGLAALGVDEIRLIETDIAKAQSLAEALSGTGGAAPVASVSGDAAACVGVDAVINCTPVGMTGMPGTPVPAECLAGIRWAFEAVYTPMETTFKTDAEAAGAKVVSGFDLFFHQGIHAFEIFTGRKPTGLDTLRRTLVGATSTAPRSSAGREA
jgi:shikimate dehydrogenase